MKASLLLACVGALALTSVSAADVHACQCESKSDVGEAFKNAKVALTARVQQARSDDRSAVFTVERVYKGETTSGKTFVIEFSGSTCDQRLGATERVLFLSDEMPPKSLSICDPHVLVPAAAKGRDALSFILQSKAERVARSAHDAQPAEPAAKADEAKGEKKEKEEVITDMPKPAPPTTEAPTSETPAAETSSGCSTSGSANPDPALALLALAGFAATTRRRRRCVR